MAERSVMMSRPAAEKSDKARACQREQYARARISREKNSKGHCLPSGTGRLQANLVAKSTF